MCYNHKRKVKKLLLWFFQKICSIELLELQGIQRNSKIVLTTFKLKCVFQHFLSTFFYSLWIQMFKISKHQYTLVVCMVHCVNIPCYILPKIIKTYLMLSIEDQLYITKYALFNIIYRHS